MKVVLKRIIKENDIVKIENGHIFYYDDEYYGVDDIHITKENITLIREIGEIEIDLIEIPVLKIKIGPDTIEYQMRFGSNERLTK